MNDNSDFEMNSEDVDELIVSVLSSGPKSPDELLNLVKQKANISDRTYYRHLEKLLKINVIEKIAEKNDGSQLYFKYILKASKNTAADNTSSLFLAEPVPFVEEVLPSRQYLEIAAWLKREPDDWPPLEAVRKAKLVLDNYGYAVPVIEASCEDPDRYAFVWSKEAFNGQRFDEFVQQRFFKLKDVYQTIVEEPQIDLPCKGETVFVGAYGSDVRAEQVTYCSDSSIQIGHYRDPVELNIVEEPFSVCVAVCKEVNGGLRVIHVEGRSGKIDKSWVKGVAKQLGSKSQIISSYETLKEDSKRDVLLELRNVLGKQALKVPGRYVKLIEEILDYSYKNPSSGYVHALALAVDLTMH